MGYNNWIIYKNAEKISVTGLAIEAKGSLTLTIKLVVNKNPNITSTPITTATEDSLYTYNVIATDENNDFLHFSDNSTLFDINPTTGVISFIPKTNREAGNHSIKLIVVDFKGGFGTQAYNLTITAVNDAPVLDFIATITAQENKSSTFVINAKDEETASSNLIYNVSGVSFATISNNIITFSPNIGDAGTYSINITVSDGSLTDLKSVTLFVFNTSHDNSPPTIESFSPTQSTINIRADTNQTFNITFNDNDGNNTVSIQWLLDGLEQSGKNNNSFTFKGNFTDTGTNAGTHTVTVSVFDGLASTSKTWILVVNITRDADGDGIPNYLDSCPYFAGSCNLSDLDGDIIDDTFDFLQGNITFVDKNIPLDFQVNGSTDINKIFNGTLPVKFTTTLIINNILFNQPTIEFDFKFSNETKLNLNDIIVKHFDTNSTGSVLIGGINLVSQKLTKSVYLKRVNESKKGICIKDKEINSIDEITSVCNATDEVKVECDGTKQNAYTCTLNSTTNYYKIEGLNHSGSKQIDFTKPAEAAPSAPSAPSAGAGAGGGGGGGGGGGLVPTPKQEILPSIKVSTDLLKVSLKEDQIITESLSITNDGNVKLNLNLKIKDLEEFISLSDNSIKLEPGETKIISLKITGKLSGAYSGKLLIESTEISKALKIFIEIKPKQALFDTKIKINSKYKQVKKGSYVEALIDLINIGEPLNVNLYYAIRDLDGNIISFDEETLRVSDELSVIRKLKVPENTNQGNYIFYVKAAYNGNIAISSDLFTVLDKSTTIIEFEFPLIGLFAILILILTILTILNLRGYKEVKYIIKVNEILGKIKYWGKEKKEVAKEDLERQLQILTADLQSGYINKATYDKQKKKIEEKFNKIKN